MSHLLWSDPDAEKIFASHELASLEEFAGLELGTVKSAARTRYVRQFELGGSSWYLKVQDLRGKRLPGRKLISYFFRGSPVEREARNIPILQELGVRTPRLVASGDSRRRGFPELAVLLTRDLTGYVNLVDYLARCAGKKQAVQVMELADALVHDVHAKGYVLLGAKYRNILVHADEARENIQLALVDQPDLLRSRRKRLRAKDWRHMQFDRERYGP